MLSASAQAEVMAQDHGAAVLDLSHWDGESILPLTGPWEFYWEKWIEPGQDLPEPDAFLEAGRRWNEAVLKDGRKLGSFGYASYRLRIKGLKARASGYEFLLRFANTHFTVKIFGVEQTLVSQASIGDPTLQAQSRISRLAYLPFLVQDGQTYEIIIWVSNRISFDGGIWTIPELAAFGHASFPLQREGFINLIAVGILSATGFYCFMLWWRRRDDKPALFLSLTALAAVLRIVSTIPWILQFFPDEIHELLYRFEYGSMPFAMTLYVHFLYGLYGRNLQLKIRNALTIYGFALCTFSLLAPVYYLSRALIFYHISTFSSVLIGIFLIIGALRRRDEGVIPTAMGCLLIVLGCIYDIVIAAPALFGNSIFVTPIAGAIFFILQAQVIAKRAANAYSRAEAYAKDIDILNQSLMQEVSQRKELNASLEIKVNERTSEIRSLLQHIPQGILTIGEEGLIGANYSSHLHDMIHESSIANRSFKSVIFDHAQLSPDVIDRAWQTILATIDEDVLNFEMNADNLPTEFTYQGPCEVRLRCTWNIEHDSDHIVRRILVTLLDITAEVESRKRLDEKNKEFQIVRQLIDIGPVKGRQFFNSCRDLLAENRHLIATSPLDIEAIKILFINVHTLKGSARTLQLTDIASIFHDVESYFVEILRQGATIHRERLERDLAQCMSAVQQYEAVNANILGRNEDENRITIERHFLEQQFQIFKTLSRDGVLSPHVKKMIRDNCSKLGRLVFLSLHTVLDDIFKQVPRMAQELAKEEPLISISMGDIMISHSQEVTIRNSFIHLLRNSLDHGIETAEQRRVRGKPERGKITLSAEQNEDEIIIRYEDDGAGLAIDQLRKKGMENHHIDSQSSLQEIANLIFHQGISTSSSVSMISGRGVGMGAVRRFVEAEGGQVQLCLDEAIDQDCTHYGFHFIIQLPNSSDSLIQKVAG
jgi:two-component sensor histidine kinase/PAS domain-containing protein